MSAALPLIDEFPHNEDTLESIFKSWARVSPKDAFARVETLSGDLRDAVLQAIAGTSPEKALALVREEGGSKMKRLNAEASVLSKLIKEDPIEATSHVLAMTPGRKRYKLLGQLVRERAQTAPEDTLAWGKTLPEGSEKQAVIATAVSRPDLNVQGIVNLLDEIGWHHAAKNALDASQVISLDGASGGYNDDGSRKGSIRTALPR